MDYTYHWGVALEEQEGGTGLVASRCSWYSLTYCWRVYACYPFYVVPMIQLLLSDSVAMEQNRLMYTTLYITTYLYQPNHDGEISVPFDELLCAI